MNIATWNVLYRSFEEKYVPESDILKTYEEPQRIIHQLNFLDQLLSKNNIVCLQEVSGDLLEEIKLKFGEHFDVSSIKHNREPQKCIYEYKFPTEHLVTVSNKKHKLSFTDILNYDDKKGALIIGNDEYLIINVHLPIYKDTVNPTETIVTTLYEQIIKNNLNKKIILCGDFNRIYDEMLIEIYNSSVADNCLFSTCMESNGSIPLITIPRENKTLDYIVAFSEENNMTLVNFEVLNTNTSDHMALCANIYSNDETVKILL